jgi:hypothetical protein
MTRNQFPGFLEQKNKREQKSNQNQKTCHQKQQQRNNQKKSPTASRPDESKKPERKKKKFLIEEKFSIKRNTSTMSSHQAVSVQHRQATRSELAKLKGVAPKSLPYPRSNAKLQEYKAEISQIREAITNEEADRLRKIDPDPHYEVIFECRDQVCVGEEITDSNFTADIAINTPGEHDFMELLSANSATIQSILQDERSRLGPIKIRMGIYAIM